MTILSFSLFTHPLAAQPTLPDISGTFIKDHIALVWNCQYSAIKAISVLRSKDSTGKYEVIGYVNKTDKGIQNYTDSLPPPGRNYYKLILVFNSGLTWHSNHFAVQVPFYNAPVKTYRADNPNPGKSNIAEKESDVAMPKSKLAKDTCTIPSKKPSLSVSIAEDTAKQSSALVSAAPVRPKIIFRQERQPYIETPVNIRSGFIYTDSATGHIDMHLPDDVATHHYSLKFYDAQNHLLFDVPRINNTRIIFDRRNFQHNGIYKFVIRKDYLELESGYIVINPSQSTNP